MCFEKRKKKKEIHRGKRLHLLMLAVGKLKLREPVAS
jgi:hypothetical protein